MDAADDVETLPTAQLDDGAPSAVRLVARHILPGLVLAHERGRVVGCVPAEDLGTVLAHYLWTQPRPTRVTGEGHADRIASTPACTRIGDAERAGVPLRFSGTPWEDLADRARSGPARSIRASGRAARTRIDEARHSADDAARALDAQAAVPCARPLGQHDWERGA